MIAVIALTQFAFLALSVVAIKIITQANGTSTPPSEWFAYLNTHWLWLFVVPLAWMAFAQGCYLVNKGPLKPALASAVGVFLACLSFLLMMICAFFPAL